MAGDDRLRPTRLLALVALLVGIFLLLLVLAAVQFGPALLDAIRGALGI